jgi:hypothetical protein
LPSIAGVPPNAMGQRDGARSRSSEPEGGTYPAILTQRAWPSRRFRVTLALMQTLLYQHRGEHGA